MKNIVAIFVASFILASLLLSLKSCVTVEKEEVPKKTEAEENYDDFVKIHWPFHLDNECGNTKHLHDHCCSNWKKDLGGFTCYGVAYNKNSDEIKEIFSSLKSVIDNLKDPIFKQSRLEYMGQLALLEKIFETKDSKLIREMDSTVFEPYALQTIYEKFYVTPKIVKLQKNWRFPVFDYAVNSGQYWSIRKLQLVLGLKEDGIIGDNTIQKTFEIHSLPSIERYIDERLKYIERIKHSKKRKNRESYKKNKKGWHRRIERVREQTQKAIEAYQS